MTAMRLAARQSVHNSQLAAVVRLFSSSVLNDMARTGRSPLFRRLVNGSNLDYLIGPNEPIRNIFDPAFSVFKSRNNRHEYVYKTAITHKVLLGVHSLQTASMLTEFRVENCKADVAILNGTSTVYEIKSERDRLDRLQSQVNSYRKAFANVHVITGSNHVEEVIKKIPPDIGILVLTNRFQISTIREAQGSVENVEPEVVFNSLRLGESKRILESLGFSLPNLPNTQMYEELRKRFVSLTSRQTHDGMVQELRTSRSLQPLADLAKSLPWSLRAALFSTRLRKTDHSRLLATLDTPLKNTKSWV